MTLGIPVEILTIEVNRFLLGQTYTEEVLKKEGCDSFEVIRSNGERRSQLPFFGELPTAILIENEDILFVKYGV